MQPDSSVLCFGDVGTSLTEHRNRYMLRHQVQFIPDAVIRKYIAGFDQLPRLNFDPFPIPTKATIGRETAAAKLLAPHLRERPDMTKKEAKSIRGDFNLGVRPFGRVWPKARELAGLPILAPPGRKRKS